MAWHRCVLDKLPANPFGHIAKLSAGALPEQPCMVAAASQHKPVCLDILALCARLILSPIQLLAKQLLQSAYAQPITGYPMLCEQLVI